MTLPSGTISLSQVNTELDISPSSTTINMGATAVRTLAEQPSGAIAMSDLQGQSNAQFVTATGGTIATSGDYKIHTFNSSGTFSVSQAGNAAGNSHIRLTGAHGAVRIAQFPATQKMYLITNATTDSGSSGPYAMTARLGASGNTLSIANGTTRLVSTDGTNWYDVFSSGGSYDLNGQDLVLDTDGDTKIISSTDDRIEFSIAGTGVGNFTNSSSDFVITSGVQDKDIIFKGDDNASAITALTLDMSEAGAATDISKVKAVIALALSSPLNIMSLSCTPEVITKSLDEFVITSCLLYTSPSPRDGLLSRMPSSA